AADGASEFELVAINHDVDQVWGNFAVRDPLDCNRELTDILGCRRNGIAALRLIAILSCQAYVHMLTSAVPRPVGHRQQQCSHALGFVDSPSNATQAPDQSPL